MYVPASFAETDPEKLAQFMRRQSFAILTSEGPNGLIASHLPLIFDSSPGPHGQLIGHMARANTHWRDLKGEVLALFSGPHAYISPTWYEEEGTVPTWNYVAVHAYGAFELVEDHEGLMEILRRSVEAYESPRANPWSFDESSPEIERMLKSIVGFRIVLSRIKGKWKLSQNQTEARRERVRRALAEMPGDDPRAIARWMGETLA